MGPCTHLDLVASRFGLDILCPLPVPVTSFAQNSEIKLIEIKHLIPV